jgi:hypothetical protein
LCFWFLVVYIFYWLILWPVPIQKPFLDLHKMTWKWDLSAQSPLPMQCIAADGEVDIHPCLVK